MIYLDNAATSFPKPVEVIRAVSNAFTEYGANPGRSGHDFSLKSAMCVYSARETVNDFFNGYGTQYVSFAQNCTLALNQAIKGIVNKGEHIIISSYEHNSVLRPVHSLCLNGENEYSVFDVADNDETTLQNLKACIKENSSLVAVTAVSNVFGVILPVEKIARLCKENGIKLLVDGAQGAGILNLDMKKQGISCLCAPGHKGLSGPMGTGVLLHDGCVKRAVIQGGTGSMSFDYSQPADYPERLEAGTLNVPGIAGLKAGIEYIKKYGTENIRNEESELIWYLYNGLKNIKNVILYNEYNKEKFAPLLSFNIKNMHSEETASLLNEQGVAVRGGYHCSALSHKYRNTQDTGTVRISPSKYNVKKDINILLNLVNKIAFF